MQGKSLKINDAPEKMKFATAVAAYGLLAKNSNYKGEVNKEMILNLANESLGIDPYNYRKELTELVNKF